MKCRHILICLLSFLAIDARLFAREKTDVLVMKNGDRLTGEVKGLDAGVLYVSFDYIDGTASVNWSKVDRLESKQLFVVKTQDGSVYTGTLKTAETGAGRPVQIQVFEAAAHEHTIERSQIVRMVATSENFWQRFNGDASFGAIYSKGNESNQYSLGANTLYVRERWNAGATFDSNLSSSSGTTTVTRNSLGLTALHLLPKKNWFYEGIGGLLQSSEQGISLQSLLGGGVGRYLKNTDLATIQLLGGIAWQDTTYEQTSTPATGQNVTSALIYVDGRFFKFSKTNLDATATILPALSDPGRIRMNANASYYIKILSDLKWNISFYGNWDNQPPPGLSGSDYGTSSGLSWTYGLR
jgi:hypothetical protein